MRYDNLGVEPVELRKVLPDRGETEGPSKVGSPCGYCSEGTLRVSPSGEHLECGRCRRLTLLARNPSARGKRGPGRRAW